MKSLISEKKMIIGVMSDGKPRTTKELKAYGFTRVYPNISEMNADPECKFGFTRVNKKLVMHLKQVSL